MMLKVLVTVCLYLGELQCVKSVSLRPLILLSKVEPNSSCLVDFVGFFPNLPEEDCRSNTCFSSSVTL